MPTSTSVGQGNTYVAHFNRRCCKDTWPKYWVYNSAAENEGRIGNKPIYRVLSLLQWNSSNAIKFDPVIFLFLLSIPIYGPLNSHTASQNGLLHIVPPSALVFPQHHILHTPPEFPSYSGPFFMLILLEKLQWTALQQYRVPPNASNFSTHIIVWSICVTPVLLVFNIFFNLTLC